MSAPSFKPTLTHETSDLRRATAAASAAGWGPIPSQLALRFSALERLLELTAQPAVVTLNGHPVAQNAAARILMASNGPSPGGLAEWTSARRIGLDEMQGLIVWLWGTCDSHLDWRVAELARSYRLTQRQVEVLKQLLDGDCNKDIASRLTCSVRTVELHVSALLDKTHCSSRTQLISRAWRWLWAGSRAAPHHLNPS